MIRTHKHLNLFVLLLLAASISMAAAQSEMHARDVFRSARDRFYKTNPQVTKPEPAKPAVQATERKPASTPTPRPKPTKPPVATPVFDEDERPTLQPVVNAPLGLRYSLLRQTSDSSAEEVDVDTVFHSGDKIKIKLESTDMAYLYILAKGSSGRWRVLFPSVDIAGGAHRVRPDEDLSVPPRGWFAFDEQAGEEKVFVMLSRRKVDDLDQAIERLRKGSSQPVQAPSAPAPSDDVPVMLAMHVAGARDLVFEKVSHTDAKPENAAYVVTKSAGPDSQVVAELTLKHR